jgi:hypothetical protein
LDVWIAEAMQAQGNDARFLAWRDSADLEEGLAAFAGKRAPRWQGR